MTRRQFAAMNLATLAARAAAPETLVAIPAGPFTQGDSCGDGNASELPPRRVEVAAFLVERHDVTKALWDSVYPWALRHGYQFDNEGLGKASNHPVHSVDWFDCVKWCNARSEMEGRKPVYFTDDRETAVYRAGQVDLALENVDWRGDGYRLPTAAEWEKSARGGAEGHRFPWTDTETITHERANYYSSARYEYDGSATRGYHPTFREGGPPYTSPVGHFPPNGYGLYDMAGNIWQWCWDHTGSRARMMRGGSFHRFAFNARCSNLSVAGDSPDFAFLVFGFRCVRSK